jgi:aminomethyltransferase
VLRALQRTPLHPAHEALGAQMVPFAGWEMPLQYEGILAEHRAVRSQVGVFDVSHLGRVLLEGPQSEACVAYLVPTDLAGPPVGRARYTILCTEEGGILDDLIVYRLGPEVFLLVVNAAPFPQVFPWIAGQARRFGLRATDLTSITAAMAVQGPRALALIAGLFPDLDPPPERYHFQETRWPPGSGTQGHWTWVARTGYTGEDGVEIVLPAEGAHPLWQALLEAGAKPCGLGARDSLRLEAGLLLSGQDFDTSTNPWEAGLERLVDLEKGEFIGRQALQRLRTMPLTKRLVGFQMVERAVPRSGCPVLADGTTIGRVTSGGYAPTLDKFLGLAYVPPSHASLGTRWQVEIRGRRAMAEVIARPFYRRPR